MINLRTRAAKLREAYAQRRSIQMMERRLRASLTREFNRVAKEVAASYPLINRVFQQHITRLNQILKPAVRLSALTGARRAREAVARAVAARKIASAEELDARILAWADRHVGSRVTHIARTTSKRINRVIVDGLANQDPPAEISRALRDKLPRMSVGRADTIARTETAAAMNQGQHDVMENAEEELGVKMLKNWVATEDERTRETHAAADGQTVKLDDSFEVGDSELDFPSDPNGAPEEVINCRCAVTYDML